MEFGFVTPSDANEDRAVIARPPIPLTRREFLKGAGFRIVTECGLQAHFAFRIRFPLVRLLLKQFPRLAHLDLLVDRTALGTNLGRMRLYVATKDAVPRH